MYPLAFLGISVLSYFHMRILNDRLSSQSTEEFLNKKNNLPVALAFLQFVIMGCSFMLFGLTVFLREPTLAFLSWISPLMLFIAVVTLYTAEKLRIPPDRRLVGSFTTVMIIESGKPEVQFRSINIDLYMCFTYLGLACLYLCLIGELVN